MSLFTEEEPSFPLTCYVQDYVCPAEAAPAQRMLQPLPPLLLATGQGKFLIPARRLPALCAWNLRALFSAFLLRGTGVPDRDCMVCQSRNQMKEQDLFGF